MTYTPPKYPAEIPTTTDLPNRVDDVDWLSAARYNELKKELRACLIELGTDPAGAYATVKARLDAGISLDSPVFTTKITTPIIDLTGGQIAFPASQAASANANTLDDYEEGTWTTIDGSGAGLSFTGVVGNYIKIGKQVTCWGMLTYPSTANASSANVAGLPFTTQNTNDMRSTGVVTTSTCATLIYYYTTPNNNKGALLTNVGGAVTNATMSTKLLHFMVTYKATS